MSVVAVLGEVILGRSSPAAVSIVNVSDPVHPLRRMNRTASRAPLPDTSASDPSGLKTRRRAGPERDGRRGARRPPPGGWPPGAARGGGRGRAGGVGGARGGGGGGRRGVRHGVARGGGAAGGGGGGGQRKDTPCS